MQQEPQADSPSKPSIWRSSRLTFTICIFFGLLLNTCLYTHLGFTMRCMVTKLSITTPRARAAGEFDWTRSQQGGLLSAYFYGSLVGGPIGGILCQLVKKRKWLYIIGISSQAICTIIFPVLARCHYNAAFFDRVLQGFLGGTVIPSIHQLYAIWAHPSERATLIPLAYAGMPIGLFIAFPIAGSLCQFEVDNGWPMVFYSLGGTGVIYVIIVCWLIYDEIDDHPRITPAEYAYLKETKSSKSKIRKPPIRKMIKSTPIITNFVVHFLQTWIFHTIVLSLPQLMEDLFDISLAENSLYSSAPYIGALITRILLMLTYRRIFERSGLSLTNYRKIFHLMGTGFGSIICLITTFLEQGQLKIFVTFLGIFGAVQDLCFIASYWTSYLELAPVYAGCLTGLTNVVGTSTGIIITHVITAIVKQGTKTEWNTIFYILICCYVLSGILYAIFGSSKPLPWGQFETVENENNDQ